MTSLRQKIWYLLLCLFLIQGCVYATADAAVDPDSSEKSVKMLLIKKERALNEKDRALLLTVLDPQNEFYVQEQKRWFSDAVQTIEPDSFRLELLSVQPRQGDCIRVNVRQSYQKEEKNYSVVLPMCFRETKAGLKESDLDFQRLHSDNMVISYTHPGMEESAYIALDTLRRARYVMHDRYQWKPKNIEVKLYHDPELFRQSVKLSLPFWAGGWNEAKQSIKLVMGQQNSKQIALGVVHELTHQLVSDLTNDNAAYWLQEGAAMYYEKHLLPGLHEEIDFYKNQRPDYSLVELQKIDLEKLPDETAFKYYQSCYQLFRFLVEEYGEDKIKQIFAELKVHPFLDQDTSEKKDRLNRITAQAMKKVLHITDKQLDQKWQAKYR